MVESTNDGSRRSPTPSARRTRATVFISANLDPLTFIPLAFMPFLVVSMVMNSPQTKSGSLDPIAIAYFTGLRIFLLLVLAVIVGYFLLVCPILAIFDADTDEVCFKSALRTIKRFPLGDIDTVSRIYEQNGRAYRYCLVFRKHLTRHPLRLTYMSGDKTNGLRWFRNRGLQRIFDVLHTRSSRHPAGMETAIPDQDNGVPRGDGLWKASGRRHYLWYPVFGRLIIANAVFLAIIGLCDHYGVIARGVLALSDGDSTLTPDVTRYIYLGWIAVAAVDMLWPTICLRFDSVERRLSRYRMLGLWRRDFAMSRFEHFLLWNDVTHPGLYLKLCDRKSPIRIVVSRHPPVLRAALLETAAVFGIDPWENFTAHACEVDSRTLPF